MGCPTVKVKCENDQGFMIINESDFDKESHEIFNEEDAAPKEGSKGWHALKLTELGIEFDPAQSAKELKELFESNGK